MSAAGSEPAPLAAFQPEQFEGCDVCLHCLSRPNHDLGLDDRAS